MKTVLLICISFCYTLCCFAQGERLLHWLMIGTIGKKDGREKLAQLLGYRNYAEVSLVGKMAQTPAEVTEFLQDLARRMKA